jgi:hypothetical protein
VSGYSCGTGKSPSIYSATSEATQSKQRHISTSPRNPLRSVIASTTAILGLIDQSLTKSYPKPKTPKSWSSDILSTTTSSHSSPINSEPIYQHLTQHLINSKTDFQMIKTFGKKSIDENHWLLANTEIPTSPFSRHPIVGVLVADAASRSHIAKVK